MEEREGYVSEVRRQKRVVEGDNEKRRQGENG